jgi:hypothetical protein
MLFQNLPRRIELRWEVWHGPRAPCRILAVLHYPRSPLGRTMTSIGYCSGSWTGRRLYQHPQRAQENLDLDFWIKQTEFLLSVKCVAGQSKPNVLANDVSLPDFSTARVRRTLEGLRNLRSNYENRCRRPPTTLTPYAQTLANAVRVDRFSPLNRAHHEDLR